MTYTIRIIAGAILAWLTDLEQRCNRIIGPFLCPRRY